MNIFVRPVDGARVRQPDRGFRLLDPAGEFVVKSGFWLRRLADGEVEESAPPAPEPEPASASDDPLPHVAV